MTSLTELSVDDNITGDAGEKPIVEMPKLNRQNITDFRMRSWL